MQTNAKTNKRKSVYGKGMLALFVVLCIVVAILLVWLWQVLAQYEAKTPRTALDHYFSLLAQKEYAEIQEDADFAPDEFNSWDDYFATLHATFGEAPGGFTYRQVAGSSAEAQHYAVYKGEENMGQVFLYPDENALHGWRVSAPADYLPAYTIKAPGHVRVSVNGVELAPEGEHVTSEPLPDFASLPEGDAVPVLLSYTLEPTLAEPTFAGTAPDGSACALLVDESTHTVTETVELTPEAEAEYSAALQAAAERYATFVTEDGSLAQLRAHLYPGTDLAERMAGFYQGWYLDHEAYEINNIEVFNLTSTSETTFTGEIRFEYLIVRKGETHTFPTHYQMAFAQYEGQWKLLELQVR